MKAITILVCVTLFFHQSVVIETQTVDIVQTAIRDGRFKTLVSALGAAELIATLQGNGLFTVFAPTDAAFDKISTAAFTDLLQPENKGKLARILKYHVINSQKLTSGQIGAMNLPVRVEMLDGGAVTVTRDGTSLKVNDATVVIPDVQASNGIIHAIDTVLMPSAGTSTTYFGLNQSLFLFLSLTTLFSYPRFL